MTKKTEPEGVGTAGQPARSFRFEIEVEGIGPTSARTRWVTERIASRAMARNDPESKTTKTQARVRVCKVKVQSLGKTGFKKNRDG